MQVIVSVHNSSLALQSDVLQQRTLAVDQHRVMRQRWRHHRRSFELTTLANEFLQSRVVAGSKGGDLH